MAIRGRVLVERLRGDALQHRDVVIVGRERLLAVDALDELLVDLLLGDCDGQPVVVAVELVPGGGRGGDEEEMMRGR